MQHLLTILLVFGLVVAADDKPVSRIKVSRTTTYFNGPITKDGLIDYATAINRRKKGQSTSASNSNVLFWKAIGSKPSGRSVAIDSRFFKLMGMTQPSQEGKYFHGLAMYMDREGAAKSPGPEKRRLQKQARKQLALAQSQPWRSHDQALVVTWLKSNSDALDLVVLGTARPSYYSPLFVPPRPGTLLANSLVSVELPGVQALRDCARALLARAMWHLGERRLQASWADLLACHRLGRLVGQGPTMLDVLIGHSIEDMAIRGELVFLQDGRVKKKDIAEIRKNLQLLPPMARCVVAVDLAERSMFLDAVQRLASGGGAAMENLFGPVGKQLAAATKKSADGVDWETVMSIGNGWYNRVVTAQREPDRENRQAGLQKIKRELEKTAEEIRSRSKAGSLPKTKTAISEFAGNLLVTLMFPASLKVQQAEDRFRQRFENLEIAVALAGYQRDRGKYPVSVDQLVPKYLKHVSRDGFNGRPLTYRKTTSGYVLYSVGPNGKDDQGRAVDSEPGADDISIRVPITGK